MKKILQIDYNPFIEMNRDISIFPTKETSISLALIQVCQKQQEIIEKINEIVDFIDRKVETKNPINTEIAETTKKEIWGENSTAKPNWNN